MSHGLDRWCVPEVLGQGRCPILKSPAGHQQCVSVEGTAGKFMWTNHVAEAKLVVVR